MQQRTSSRHWSWMTSTLLGEFQLLDSSQRDPDPNPNPGPRREPTPNNKMVLLKTDRANHYLNHPLTSEIMLLYNSVFDNAALC